jgi:hypothetical protein
LDTLEQELAAGPLPRRRTFRRNRTGYLSRRAQHRR